MAVFRADPDMAMLRDWPKEMTNPAQYGISAVEFEPGDYGTKPLNIVSSALFNSPKGMAKLGHVQYDGLHGMDWANIEFGSGGQAYRSVTWFDRCTFSADLTQGFRFRFQTAVKLTRCDVSRSKIQTTSDIVGMYLSDGPCSIRASKCRFSGYTDGIQFGFRKPTDFGLYRGSVIEECVFEVPPKFVGFGETMAAGLENAIDIKSGGSNSDPVRVTRNIFRGFRPAILAGGGSPGYAVTLHQCASHVLFEDNIFEDCESAIAFNQPNDQEFGHKLVDNRFIKIRNNGAATPWPHIQGAVFAGAGRFESENSMFVDCDRIEALPSKGRTF